MPADFKVRLEVLQAFRDEVKLYRIEQEAALRALRREVDNAHAFLEKAMQVWESKRDEAERDLDDCLREVYAGHPMDCSGWEREVEWCQRRIDEIDYWQGELKAAEDEFLPHANRLEHRLKWEFPRVESFLAGLVVALQRAAGRRIRL